MGTRISDPVFFFVGLFGLAFSAACSAQLYKSPSTEMDRAHAAATAGAAPTKGANLLENYGKLPLSFEANDGQADPRVKFLSRGNGYTLLLTDSSAVLGLSMPDAKHRSNKTDVIRMELAGAASDTRAIQGDELPGKVNYFIGRESAKWHTGVPTYAKVRYSAVYPGVDLMYYGNQRQLEYDFVIAPNADPRAIRLRFAGARRLTLTADGDLSISARNGQIAFHKPAIYQEIDGQRQAVDGRFLLEGRTVGFALGAYDHSAALVIDPALSYSTYLGGTGPDKATAVALDAAGDAYITGYTFSANFPLGKSPYQGTNFNTANGSAFVTKLNATGTALVYSTYLGGSGGCLQAEVAETLGDVGTAIAVDGSGEAFATGIACSADFPVTAGAFQTSQKDSQRTNAFVTKLSADGSKLLYSTYLGGSGGGSNPGDGDMAQGIAVDSAGNAYIAGQAFSPDFPTTAGAFQTATYACCNTAFVTKFNPTGSALIYSTFVGNENSDAAFAIAIDSAGDAYITGYTIGGSFPVTSNAFQQSDPGASTNVTNAFVTKLNPTGSGLLYSTYLGGTGTSWPSGDSGNAIAVDASGNAYVTGETFSEDFPVTQGAFQTSNLSPAGAGSAFASKVDTLGGALVYSTYLGGSQNGLGSALAVDGYGNLYLAGLTYASDFPLAGKPYQSTNRAWANSAPNAFLTELNPKGSQLIYSTYLGGSGSPSGTNCGPDMYNIFPSTNGDGVYGMALGSSGAVYLVGETCSADFPTTHGVFQPATGAPSGGSNAFVAGFNLSPPATVTTLSANANPQYRGEWVTFTATVAALKASTLPTGTVVFSVDGSAVPSVAVTNGEATWTTSSLTPGTHVVEAVYGGSASFASSSSSLKEKILPPQTGLPSAPLPTFSPVPGKYTGSVVVTLGDTVPNAEIYYTVGSSAAALYTGPITVQAGYTTIEAFASATGYDPSAIVQGAYSVVPEAPTPFFSPGPGSYAPGQEVAISDANPTATIRYTTDGSTPTNKSALYTRTLSLTGTETIQAIAIASGDAASTVASATYTPE